MNLSMSQRCMNALFVLPASRVFATPLSMFCFLPFPTPIPSCCHPPLSLIPSPLTHFVHCHSHCHSLLVNNACRCAQRGGLHVLWSHLHWSRVLLPGAGPHWQAQVRAAGSRASARAVIFEVRRAPAGLSGLPGAGLWLRGLSGAAVARCEVQARSTFGLQSHQEQPFRGSLYGYPTACLQNRVLPRACGGHLRRIQLLVV